jgi:hypothetical protein
MISLLLHLLRLLPFVCGGPRQLALENLAYASSSLWDKRTARPTLRRTDHLFWHPAVGTEKKLIEIRWQTWYPVISPMSRPWV